MNSSRVFWSNFLQIFTPQKLANCFFMLFKINARYTFISFSIKNIYMWVKNILSIINETYANVSLFLIYVSPEAATGDAT